MDVDTETINLQTFYILCRNTIYNHPETYHSCLDQIQIVTSWVNTIDSLDVSLIICDTMKLIGEITSTNEISRYISTITEITIILNNIFYSADRPYIEVVIVVIYIHIVVTLFNLVGVIIHYDRIDKAVIQ